MNIKIMASLQGLWARGAEICTLNLLKGLKVLGYKELFAHATLPHSLPEDMELYLLDEFNKVAHTCWTHDRNHDGKDTYLRDRMNALDPDILLYTYDKSIPGLAPDTKSVLVVHGIAENDFAGYHPEHTDAVVCVSQYAADMAEGYGIPPEKTHTILNGVPQIEPASISKKELRFDMAGITADWVWCFIGGLTRLKRPHLLIAALARRKRRSGFPEYGKDEAILFAGMLDAGMRLDEYAKSLGVADQCVFLGHVDEVSDVYNASDCLVITSERESMPLTILEAMSAGLGVVANPVGGIKEVLADKQHNISQLVDVTREEDFDVALDRMRLMRLPQIVPCVMIIDAKQAWKQDYSLEIMTSNYDKLFRELLGGA